ncbi:MAG: hypothetical protein AB7R55_21655 [Gemmatimonadales bacterium]
MSLAEPGRAGRLQRAAALLYTALSLVVIGFQIALAAGAPWGEYAMGGAYPGRVPPPIRVTAVLQGGLAALLASVVLARAGVAVRRWARSSRRWIWAVVALALVSTVLNLITPSAGERARWAPVAVALLLTSLIVARGPAAER